MVLIRTLWLLLLLGALACARREPPAALGNRLVAAEVVDVRASSDGAFLAYLRDCRKRLDRTLPAGAASCVLEVVPAGGGQAVRVAAGVSTPGHGFGWSAAGHVLAALGDHDQVEGRGTLVVWAGGAPRTVAADATFHAFDRAGGRLGWIAGGQLWVEEGGGGPAVRIAGADGVTTFEFGGRRGVELLARRSARRGGTLLGARGEAAWPVAADVHQYAFATDGARFAFTAGTAQSLAVETAELPARRPAAPRPLGRDVQSFLFSPASDAVAFVADAVPGRQGDLWVAPAGGPPVLLARRVGEPRWARGGAHLAWLQEYDPRSRTGVLAVGGPGQATRVVAPNVSDFDLTRDASSVACLVHDTAGGYSVNLVLATAGAPPATVARGVFGFSFSPDGRWLYYRSACTREAEACDLLRIPAGGLPPGAKPERVAEAAKSFEFAPGRPDRLLLTWARKDRIALDLAVWEGGRLVAVDTSAVPGTARFLGNDASRLVYAVNDPKRPGVYVAEVRETPAVR